MGKINSSIVYSINRLKTKFTCEIGNAPINIHGTGFWIVDQDKSKYFITNRHNLDPTLKLGEKTTYKLSELSIEIRRIDKKPKGDSTLYKETKFFPVNNLTDSIIHSDGADCSLVLADSGITLTEGFEPVAFSIKDLADGQFLREKVQMMDEISFIGFPSSTNTAWWDTEWNLPISRQGTVSSIPGRPYKNAGIKTEDAILISGMSFPGSSGSPVILHESGGFGGFRGKDYVPSKIIGIMSGHWWKEESTPEIFLHTGLSYFTSARSIFSLIKKTKGKTNEKSESGSSV